MNGTVKVNQFAAAGKDCSPYVDSAFGAVAACRKDMAENPELTVNATAGVFCGKDGTIAAFDSVYNTFDSIEHKVKAGYASGIQGNADFCDAIFGWINRLGNIKLPCEVVASTGGTGAIALAMFNCTERGSEVLIPKIGWTSYKVMAGECGATPVFYDFFEDGKVCLDDIKAKSAEIMDRQGKVVLIINDPCQNPTGVSLGLERWKELVEHFNELSKKGPVVIINDIAYIDYSYDCANATRYMDAFDVISENVAVMVAFSCSKTLTVYGMRLGALLIMCKEREAAEGLKGACIRWARANWSNCNNGLMKAFVKLLSEHREEFAKEKQEAINQLSERSGAFLKAANECGLECYPYNEGFFVTVRVEDEEILGRFNEKLMENHIYGVRFAKGMRFAVCSMDVPVCASVPARIKAILESVSK